MKPGKKRGRTGSAYQEGGKKKKGGPALTLVRLEWGENLDSEREGQTGVLISRELANRVRNITRKSGMHVVRDALQEPFMTAAPKKDW